MPMGLKEKGFTFSDLQKHILNTSCFKWLSITFERKKGEKEKMRASVILKLKTSKELLKVTSYLYSL